MDKKTAICQYLKKHHTGGERAVYSRELQRLFSIDGACAGKLTVCGRMATLFAATSAVTTTLTARRKSMGPYVG